MRKVLDKIEPFNFFWLGSCYHHAVVSAMPHYGIKAIEATRCLYPQISADFNYKKADFDTVYQKVGIDLIPFNCVSADDIIERIERERAVIAGVDCFEISYRADCYRKKHVLHFILVFGYDTLKKTFSIVEHKYVNSYAFEVKEIDFSELLRAIESYNTSFRKDENNCNELTRSAYPNTNGRLPLITKERTDILIGNLKRYSDLIDGEFSEFLIFYEKISNYIQVVLTGKRMIQKLILGNKTTEINDYLVSGYTFLATTIMKAFYTKDQSLFQGEKKEKIKNKINELITLENELMTLWKRDI